MTSYEFGGGVYNDVGSMLYRAQQIGGGECVVDHEQCIGVVGYFGYCVNVGHIAVGIAECFSVHNLCVWTDGFPDSFEVVEVHNGVFHASRCQGVGDQIE